MCGFGKRRMTMIYNEINLGFARLVVYTDETGVVTAQMKSSDYDFAVPAEEIYTEKVVE